MTHGNSRLRNIISASILHMTNILSGRIYLGIRNWKHITVSIDNGITVMGPDIADGRRTRRFHTQCL